MDSNYIINRLKTTPYKYTTVNFLRSRLSNLEEEMKQIIIANLKKQLYQERNLDIQQQLFELIYRMPLAS
ncbi:hypothetical protein [Flavobacterium sp. 25HG05S-40]|uniref:hypothetical protein n=1 Tax=Flavobacterium sp. 25HG05S-40 TaxID=3458682 RepID=UPI004044825C